MTPSRAAGALLLCIDLQPAFVNAMPGAALLLRRCALAIETAQGLGLPVAFTEQMPQKLGGTAPELLALVARPVVWGKSAFSALADDGIRDALRRRAVSQLFICGLETPVCIYQTALAALADGFQVTVLSDAVTARRADDARTALAALAQDGVKVLPAETVFYALLHDAAHPFFKGYTRLVKEYA